MQILHSIDKDDGGGAGKEEIRSERTHWNLFECDCAEDMKMHFFQS